MTCKQRGGRLALRVTVTQPAQPDPKAVERLKQMLAEAALRKEDT